MQTKYALLLSTCGLINAKIFSIKVLMVFFLFLFHNYTAQQQNMDW